MKKLQSTADEIKVNQPVLSGELRPFCACRELGGNLACTTFSACTYWRQLNARTVKNSWLDRFLRAFTVMRIKGQFFLENMSAGSSYPSILFTPFEGKYVLKDLKIVVYTLHQKYSFPMALYLEGYALREIAEILELPFMTVLMRIAYAQRRLLAMIQDPAIVNIKIGNNPAK